MATDRRAFLAGSGALTIAALAPACAGAGPTPLYAAARRGADGRHGAAIFTSGGMDIATVALPDRGHDIAVCPVTRRCVVFARRPGSFAVAFSAARTSPPVSFEAPPDRHFYGHGVFSPDGRLLYTTENDFEAGRGMIGVYGSTAGYRRLGEMPSFGLGPHDLALIDEGRVLVVANGGLKEHPDFGNGRRILNPGEIQTSLAYIDAATGDLLERHELAAGGQISLRHLDANRDGTVVLGAQIVRGAQGQGDEAEHLVYRHRRQRLLKATRLTDGACTALSGYVSSVAVDSSGTSAAVTSSRSGSVVVIDISTGRLLKIHRLTDVSGVAETGAAGTFLVTTGDGSIAESGSAAEWAGAPVATGWNWDNHAVRL